MKLWRRIWHASATRIILAYCAIVALSLEWALVENRQLLDQAPPALVYRAGFAGAGVLVLAWTGANIYIRVRRLEDRVMELESR